MNHIIHSKTLFFKILTVILQIFIKMASMDEENAVFEQLTLSDFKKWRSTAVNAHSQV